MKPSSRFLNWRNRFGSRATEGPHPPAMPEKQPVEIEGKRYTGFYTVSSGVVTVESDWGERSTEAVGPLAERTARLLLLETLRRAKSAGYIAAATQLNQKQNLSPAVELHILFS